MDSKERRQIGAHYTAEKNILKLIRSLFLDDLRAEFESIKADRSTRRTARLQEFHDKLASLHFLDPACGCGNFLVLTYRELRKLELEVLLELHGQQHEMSLDDVNRLSKLNVHQFYGIEVEEFPARIAEVALWLTDHQANIALSQAFSQLVLRLPLRASPHIVVGNALRIDWRTVLPPEQCSFVLGNPPFVGKHLMNGEQGADMELVWSDITGTGVLDYVTAWYKRAAEYIHHTRIPVAFVSTNSITQGEQVGALWPPLFQRYGLKIHFGHRTFAWESEARGKAHVHVVIIGFGAFDTGGKRIYDYADDGEKATVSTAGNISPYLIEGSDVAIASRSTPVCEVPECMYGNKPTDGGHLIVEEQDRKEFLEANPEAKQFIRPLLCAEEYLYSIPRWCLWLVDASPSEIRSITGIKKRVEAVRDFRLASKKGPTREMANQPTLFAEIRQPKTRYMLVPQHTSQLRRYVPFGYFSPNHIVHNSCSAIPDATLYHFGVLSSEMHMAWVKTVCGRIKSDYRYSTNLVYNNYPWPAVVTDKQRVAVEAAAQAVLDARAQFPTSTLADLYDPLTMPAPLLKSHQELDRAVDRCYRPEPFPSDRHRVEYLFALYEKITAPLIPTQKKRRRASTK